MGKALTSVVALVGITAAAWSGFWFYGKGKIVEEIEAQAQLVRDQGGEASYESIDVSGFPFGYEGRIISPKITMAQPATEGTAPITLKWSAPWIEAKANAASPNVIEMTVADTQELLINLPEEDGGPLPVALTSSNLIIETEVTKDGVLFRGGATTMGGRFERMTDKAGMANVTYTIDDLKTSGRVNDKTGDTDQPPMVVEYTLARIGGTADITGTPQNPGGKIDFKTAAITGTTDTLGDETTGKAVFNDLDMSFEFAQLGNLPLDLGIEQINLETRIPNGAAAEAQPFGYRMSMKNVTLADLIWTFMDPQQAFSREINNLTIDIDGTAIFTATPSNAEAFAEAMETGLPIDVQTLRLNDLTVDALGLTAKGTGEGALRNDVPEGKASVGIDGFPEFMKSMVQSGRIPPQQAMVVQLMVENFGKVAEGEETIRFDLEARDGMMYVNSLPVGQAPALPQ